MAKKKKPTSPRLPVPAGKATLPQSYESARNALATCERLDECKEWADKAKALASYAKQAGDESLHRYADRIKARAVRRSGELLQQIKSAKGTRSDQLKGGAPPKLTRKRAATDAGLSADQARQAKRVASVPAAEFERQVESAKPPTVTALAKQGTKKRKYKPMEKGQLYGRTYMADDVDEQASSDQARWERSCGAMLGELISLRAYWRKEFGPWEKFDVPSALAALAKQAAEEVEELAKQLQKR